MNTTLKRTTVTVLIVAYVVELVVIGMFFSGNRDAYASVEGSEKTMLVSDVEYVKVDDVLVDDSEEVAVEPAEMSAQAEESATESVETAAQAEEVIADEDAAVDFATEWQPEETEYVYEEANYGYSDDAVPYDDIAAAYGITAYDGSGYYDANVNNVWHEGSEFAYTGGYLYKDASGMEFTWYSENALPGGGLDIPGRHVGDEGYVCDANGNVCLASDYLPEGTVVNVPFGSGTGVVYDTGCGYNDLDVYVSW